MSKWSLRSLSLLAVCGSVAGLGFFTAGTVRSQLGVAKIYVQLQASSPGTAQAGHVNVTGAVRAGTLVGNGSGLTNLNAAELQLPLDRDQPLAASMTGVIDITNTSNSATVAAIAGTTNTFSSTGILGTGGPAPGWLPSNITGVYGRSIAGFGVVGYTQELIGVLGFAGSNSPTATGVRGSTQASNGIGVEARATNGTSIGLSALGPVGGLAGKFEGRVWVDGGMTIGPASLTNLGASRLGVGSATSTAFDGMSVVAGPTGQPFYGYQNNGTFSAISYYSPSTQSLRFGVGTDHVALTSIGSLGLGTLSPLRRFHVMNAPSGAIPNLSNDMAVFEGSTSAQILAMTGPTGVPAIRFQTADVNQGGIFANRPTNQNGITIETGLAQPRITITETGNVGIGTPTPTTLLDVEGGQTFLEWTRGPSTAPTVRIENGSSPTYAQWKWGLVGAVGAGGGNGTHHVAFAGSAAGGTTENRGFQGFATAATPGTNIGVYGAATSGATNWAGFFPGDLFANSASSGVKAFLIDHPLDPENRYLEHSSIESNERMNLYRGQVVTDGRGYASVTVPSWFGALNGDIQYQLTVIDESDSDSFVQAKVVRRLQNGAFRIRTSAPNTTVNWQVSGVRIDPVARAHPLQVEREKKPHERGKLLFPEAYGYSSEHGMTQLGVTESVPTKTSTQRPKRK